MAKLSAWLVTLIGVVWILAFTELGVLGPVLANWLIGLSFLVMGIGKLMRNYKKRGR